MGTTSRSSRRRRAPWLLTALLAVCWLLVPAAAMAASSSDEADTTTTEDESAPVGNGTSTMDDTQSPAPSTAAIEVTVTPLVADGRDDGDLITVDEDAGLVALFFSPSAPTEQRAMHEVRVRNTGDVPLSGVEVTDDQMGTIIDAASGTQLAPGEELVTSAAMAFTFEEVSTVRGGLFSSTTTATATAEDSTVVSDTADTRVELVAVLSSPSIDVVLDVVPGAGDVEVGDPPLVRWTSTQQEADEVRVVRYRVSVTNTSTVDLEGVTVTLDVLDGPVVAADEGVVLAPDEVLVREFDRELRPSDLADPITATDASAAAGTATDTSDAAPADGTGEIVVDLNATATVTALDSTQDLTATARADALVRGVLAPTQLPATGLDAAVAGLLAVTALVGGAALLRRSRPVTTARPAGHPGR